MEDLALAVVEHTESRREHGPVLRDLVLVLLGPDRLERVQLLAVVLAAAARGERQRRVRPAGLERLQHFLLFRADGLCQLGDRRRASELHGQLLDQLLARLEVAFLVIPAQENLVGLAHALAPLSLSTRFDSSTHWAPSWSVISTRSQTVARIRWRLSESSPPSASSARTAVNGPITVRSSPSSMRTRRVTSCSLLVRSSSASRASSRSSRCSNVRSRRTARPPTTRWATRWNAPSAGSVNEISSKLNVSLQSDPRIEQI